MLAYTGNPVKRRLDFILAAWQRARREGETLVVAGIERPDDPAAGVRYTGRLPPDEYRALQRRARVYVAAPLREDFGIAPLEALADGCMLVTTPSPGPYPALGLARRLDPRLVSDDLAPALRAALDDPRPRLRLERPRRCSAVQPRRGPGDAWPSACSRDSCQDGGREHARVHSQPGQQRVRDRAVLLPRLRDRLRVRGGGGDPDLALGLGSARAAIPTCRRRGRGVGLPGRADRRPDLLHHHHPQPGAPITGGGCSRSGRAASASGAGSPPGGRRAVAGSRRLGRADLSPVHGRGGAGAARRPGDRPDRQLLQPGAVRQADHAALGPGDQPRPPAARASCSTPPSSPRSCTRSSGTWRWPAF